MVVIYRQSYLHIYLRAELTVANALLPEPFDGLKLPRTDVMFESLSLSDAVTDQDQWHTEA